MLNKKKKIVYLLGAGAMIDFGGPTTSYLTDECKKIVENSVLEKIIDLLDKTYDKKYNFETIIAAVEYLLDYAIATQTQGYITVNNTNIVRVLFKSVTKKIDSEKIWDVYKDLINMVIVEIAKYESEINPSNKLLSDYLSRCQDSYKLKIYTLNYDRLIPNVMENVNDGTVKVEINKYRLFNYKLKSFISDNFTHFNLHGSIYLKQEMPRGFYYSVVQSSCPKYLKDALVQEGGSPNDKKIFSPIITGYSKSQRIMSEPFNFGFAAFSGDCDDCDHMVIVGYSFSDPHINSIIKSFIVEKNKKITIVDYSKENNYSEIENKLASIFISNPLVLEKTDYGARSKDDRINIYIKGFKKYLEDATIKQ